MPKLKLPDIDKVVAIDIHTHAEEPCGCHADDGYDDFQARMAEYFGSPNKHPPTVPETAAYYRSKNIAAVIFPVDAERETGFRRYNNYEMQTGVGSGMPGGMGMRLKYSNPMYMDDVAADFPDLKIILAHPSFPWQEEALSVATHKPNVYIDLSGWSPKYFPPILVRYINSILQDKMLFGSDWPVITPDRWMSDFAKLEIREEVRPKVLKANARKLLNI